MKGKAELMREYKTMIQEEYGKEKKKKIFTTMYQPVKERILGSSLENPCMNIRLNIFKQL